MTFAPEPLSPQPLHIGDTIGIFFPGGPIRDIQRFDDGIKVLENLGFTTHCRPDIPHSSSYLANSDSSRLQEFHDIWKNPDVQAVMAGRGGYGCLRLLDQLDYALIKSHPKYLIGFSDITTLHAAIHHETGLISLHGPVVTSLATSDAQSRNRFFNTLTSTTFPAIPLGDTIVLRNGNARGRLTGGNLTTLCHLLATPFNPSWDKTILLLEDVGESAYRLDRMLTQLKLAGQLSGVKGIILGTFKDCGKEEDIWERMLEVTEDIPVWGNFPIGHGTANFTLPLGVTAVMDTEQRQLCFPPKKILS